MRILDIINEVATLAGVSAPFAAVVDSDNPTALQLLAQAQQEGDALSRAHPWKTLKASSTIIGDSSTEYWPLPADFDRLVAGDNLWKAHRPDTPLNGPRSDEDFLAIKAASYAPPLHVWRFFGNQIQIWPVLSSGETVRFEYRTENWILATNGVTTKARFTSDDDTPRVPDILIKLGTVWRFKRSKGLDYAEEMQTYEQEKFKAIRADSGFSKLVLNDFSRDAQLARRNAYRVMAP